MMDWLAPAATIVGLFGVWCSNTLKRSLHPSATAGRGAPGFRGRRCVCPVPDEVSTRAARSARFATRRRRDPLVGSRARSDGDQVWCGDARGERAALGRRRRHGGRRRDRVAGGFRARPVTSGISWSTLETTPLITRSTA